MKKDGMMVRSWNNSQVQIALFKFVVPSSLLASILAATCCCYAAVALVPLFI